MSTACLVQPRPAGFFVSKWGWLFRKRMEVSISGFLDFSIVALFVYVSIGITIGYDTHRADMGGTCSEALGYWC